MIGLIIALCKLFVQVVILLCKVISKIFRHLIQWLCRPTLSQHENVLSQPTVPGQLRAPGWVIFRRVAVIFSVFVFAMMITFLALSLAISADYYGSLKEGFLHLSYAWS